MFTLHTYVYKAILAPNRRQNRISIKEEKTHLTKHSTTPKSKDKPHHTTSMIIKEKKQKNLIANNHTHTRQKKTHGITENQQDTPHKEANKRRTQHPNDKQQTTRNKRTHTKTQPCTKHLSYPQTRAETNKTPYNKPPTAYII